MSDLARKCESAASALVVTAFASFWLIASLANEPREFPIMYLYSAIFVALMALLWVVAVRLVCRRWNTSCAATTTAEGAYDGPATLLEIAVAALPSDRRDWGSAMVAELAQVQGRGSRWRFAAGCARTAVFPPRGTCLPVLIVGALAIAAALSIGPVMERTLPAMRVFAVAFVAIVGALAVLVTARTDRLVRAVPDYVMALAVALAVAACVAATATFLVRHPTAAEFFTPPWALAFSVILAGCLGCGLWPMRAIASSRCARVIGGIAAAVLGLGFVWVARSSVHTLGGPLIWVLFAPVLIFFVAAAISAVVGQSFRAGFVAAVWAALLGALLVCALALPEAAHRFELDGRTLADGESGYDVGVNLPDAIWNLIQIPLFGLPFGAMGAAFGDRMRGWRRPAAKRRTEDCELLLRKPPPLGGI